jgi:hypothetical protein
MISNMFIMQDYFEFLGEFKSIFETVFAHDSEPRGNSLMKKTKGRKSPGAVPSNTVTFL